MTSGATATTLQCLVAACGAAPFAVAACRTKPRRQAAAWWMGAAFAAVICLASDPVAVALGQADAGVLGPGCGR